MIIININIKCDLYRVGDSLVIGFTFMGYYSEILHICLIIILQWAKYKKIVR